MSQEVVLYDFDGTITFRDSLLDFLIFTFGKVKVLHTLFFSIPNLFLFKLKLRDNHDAKERLFSAFFKNCSCSQFQQYCNTYAEQRLPAIIKMSAVSSIREHQALGRRTVIVTASIEDWIKPWADKVSLEVVGTKIEIQNEIVTGRFSTRNCHGAEKVARINSLLGQEGAIITHAYGDSAGDFEMLGLADQAYYKQFK